MSVTLMIHSGIMSRARSELGQMADETFFIKKNIYILKQNIKISNWIMKNQKIKKH